MKLLVASTILGFVVMWNSTTNSMPDRVNNQSSTVRFNAKYYIDTVHVQDQQYTVTRDQGVEEYEEVGTFLSNPSILAKARIRLVDNEYDEVEIEFDNGTLASHVLLKRQGRSNVFDLFHNGNLTNSYQLNVDNFLFEGPNPMFDFVNATKVLEIKDGETLNENVFPINWVDGSLRVDQQAFQRTADTIRIAKSTPSRVAEFSLGDVPHEIVSYKQNTERYVFTAEDVSGVDDEAALVDPNDRSLDLY